MINRWSSRIAKPVPTILLILVNALSVINPGTSSQGTPSSGAIVTIEPPHFDDAWSPAHGMVSSIAMGEHSPASTPPCPEDVATTSDPAYGNFRPTGTLVFRPGAALLLIIISGLSIIILCAARGAGRGLQERLYTLITGRPWTKP